MRVLRLRDIFCFLIPYDVNLYRLERRWSLSSGCNPQIKTQNNPEKLFSSRDMILNLNILHKRVDLKSTLSHPLKILFNFSMAFKYVVYKFSECLHLQIVHPKILFILHHSSLQLSWFGFCQLQTPEIFLISTVFGSFIA